MNILNGAESNDRLCLLHAGDTLDTAEKILKRLGALRDDLDQIVKISGEVMAFEDLILRVDESDKIVGEAGLLQTDEHHRRELETEGAGIDDRGVLGDNSGGLDLADPVARRGDGQVNLRADLRNGGTRVLLKKADNLSVDGVHRPSAAPKGRPSIMKEYSYFTEERKGMQQETLQREGKVAYIGNGLKRQREKADLKGQIQREIRSRYGLRIRLVPEAAGVGIVTGAVVLLNRLLISHIQPMVRSIYSWGTGNPVAAGAVLFGAACVGVATGFLVKKEPLISGSGIPQVKGELAGAIRPVWYRVLALKFVGGLMTLGAGLTMGREGPSVQMGAAVGRGASELFRRPETEKKYLVTSGAAAGLAAAFHAPMAGVVFALEEGHQNFSATALVSAMAGAIAADFVSSSAFGLKPVLSFSAVPSFPLNEFWIIVPLGILVGAAGVLFNRLILLSKRLYDKIRCPVWIKTAIPFIITGIACMCLPSLFGSGESLIGEGAPLGMGYGGLLLLLGLKFLLLLICFGSGLPGGIFFPLLVIGSLYGMILGTFTTQVLGLPTEILTVIVLLAMAAHFAAIVRAPVTGILLVSEMTGTFAFFLPLALVSLCAYLTADLLRSKPIYDSLLELLLLKSKSPSSPSDTSGKVLREFPVEYGSAADGKTVKEIDWPDGFLLVGIRRGTEEWIPNGGSLLRGGDYIIGLLTEADTEEDTKQLENVCKECR